MNIYLNTNCIFTDTYLVTIGARTLLDPNVSLFSATHMLDPAVRNGIKEPEAGKDIHISEDCWLGGNMVVLPRVAIRKGATIGAGSVVARVCSFLFRDKG